MKVIAAAFSSVLAAAALGLPISQHGKPVTASAPGFVARRGTQLYLDGSPWRFTGVDAYELATAWGINAGCGPMVTDAQMDDLFASLRPRSAVRFWAFQGLATNSTTKQRDWRPIDRVVRAAARHGQKLIMVLSGQGGGCDDGHWKDVAWYRGGYNRAFDGDGKSIAPEPYWTYCTKLPLATVLRRQWGCGSWSANRRRSPRPWLPAIRSWRGRRCAPSSTPSAESCTGSTPGT
jgi:hypothetical protein